MAKAKTTRTLNRLPFDELEPKRFEDLIRQLIYDFRTWRQLEATGRAGSDDGYDARGWEIVADADAADGDEDEDGGREESHGTDRKWMIQCKRELKIGPTKLKGYLEGVSEEDRASLHGFIFAACCDFSLESRDAFREWCRQAGMRECFIWGRGEVEDMLFQPKNDHLLFAYFGISLQIRKRTVRSTVRARLAAKRKAKRLLRRHQDVLLRDAEDENYPYRDEAKTREEHVWCIRKFIGLGVHGLIVLMRETPAYLDENGEQWDFANEHNNAGYNEDQWITDVERTAHYERGEAINGFMEENIPEGERGKFQIEVEIPYEAIIDIDENGDDVFPGPHVYVMGLADMSAWNRVARLIVRPVLAIDEDDRAHYTRDKREVVWPLLENRVEKFPTQFRKTILGKK